MREAGLFGFSNAVPWGQLPAMRIDFTKMNGAGNDFVVIDNRERKIRLDRAQIARICDRHRGVGADGLMMLVPCDSKKADWAWDFYNADGGPAAMCGNGSRCFAKYVRRTVGVQTDFTFETLAGVIHAGFQGDLVAVDLTSPRGLRLNDRLPLQESMLTVHFINTGVEHAVVFVDDVEKVDLKSLGAAIRYHAHYAPKGTNANFVQLLGQNHIRVRTYERGVEDETMACGTGVSACALITARLHGFESPVKVKVQGGDTMEVGFDRKGDEFSNVRLTGPAEFVYEGWIEV